MLRPAAAAAWHGRAGTDAMPSATKASLGGTGRHTNKDLPMIAHAEGPVRVPLMNQGAEVICIYIYIYIFF